MPKPNKYAAMTGNSENFPALVHFGARVETSEVASAMRSVELPRDWTVTKRSTTSTGEILGDVFDERGRCRGTISTAGGPYSHIKLITFYRVGYATKDEDTPGFTTVRAVDSTGTTLYIERRPNGSDAIARQNAYSEAAEAARQWLDEQYPDWRDLTAYWNQ